jgi:hypothetical protein
VGVKVSHRFQPSDEIVQVFLILAEEAESDGWIEVADGYAVGARTVIALVRNVSCICDVDGRLDSVRIKV